MRTLFIPALVAFLLAWCAPVRADFADDLARIHMESLGGRERVLALKSLRATGVTKIQGEELHFVMWAARPNLVRTETTSAGRVLTQGYDGKNPPWLLDSKTGRIREMGTAAARAFDADASFDDPLVLRGSRKVSLDYLGETELDGVPVFKLLVAENFTEGSYLYLDHTNCLIIRRDAVKQGARGPEMIETDYGDFRAVNGVMLPHRIVEKAAGRVRYETVLDRIEANPSIMPGLFSRPVPTVKP